MSLVPCYLLTRRLTRRRRVISITQPRLNLNHDESSFLYLARLLDLNWHSTVKALQFLIRSSSSYDTSWSGNAVWPSQGQAGTSIVWVEWTCRGNLRWRFLSLPGDPLFPCPSTWPRLKEYHCTSSFKFEPWHVRYCAPVYQTFLY